METLLFLLARALVAALQALPLPVVARLGRWGGAVAFQIDRRHRRIALENLKRCFEKEKSTAEIFALAKENFRRLGENYFSAVKTAGMPSDQLIRHLEITGAEKLRPPANDPGPHSRVIAIGHFGNFEIYVRLGQLFPEFRFAATYRALRQPSLNRLLKSLRTRSGCLFFERRTEGAALRDFMRRSNLLLGLLADQHAGRSGLSLPFFGADCSTSAAPALFALRYRCPLYTAICFRVGLARWRIEVGDEIPTRENGRARSVETIMGAVNDAFEAAIRRDPANWFWVHRRWKPERLRQAREQRNPEACDRIRNP